MSNERFRLGGTNFEFESRREFARRGYRCGTAVPSALTRQLTRNVISAKREAIATRRSESVTIPVQFIHITNGSTGEISETMRVDQIKVMNAAFEPHKIKFEYNKSDTNPNNVNNPTWFGMNIDSAEERDAKTALHVDAKENLNFYTAGLREGLLGWARFPWWLEGDEVLDGVVILHSTLPGGSAAPYNLGQTATHEIGHWLGLYHTFQDGCTGDGDEVDDTIAHSEPDFGCSGNSACNGGEQSPLENYMNYTDDACMTTFSQGQTERMKEMIIAYRDGLSS
jgi:hypothetical protein